MKKIDNLKLDDLKTLLKQVKNYKDLRKQLGNRGIELFDRKMGGKDSLVVEYFADLEGASSIAIDVYKKAFNIEVIKNDIKFIEKKNLKGGIKVYKNDSMVDVSFSKVEKLIK